MEALCWVGMNLKIVILFGLFLASIDVLANSREFFESDSPRICQGLFPSLEENAKKQTCNQEVSSFITQEANCLSTSEIIEVSDGGVSIPVKFDAIKPKDFKPKSNDPWQKPLSIGDFNTAAIWSRLNWQKTNFDFSQGRKNYCLAVQNAGSKAKEYYERRRNNSNNISAENYNAITERINSSATESGLQSRMFIYRGKCKNLDTSNQSLQVAQVDVFDREIHVIQLSTKDRPKVAIKRRREAGSNFGPQDSDRLFKNDDYKSFKQMVFEDPSGQQQRPSITTVVPKIGETLAFAAFHLKEEIRARILKAPEQKLNPRPLLIFFL